MSLHLPLFLRRLLWFLRLMFALDLETVGSFPLRGLRPVRSGSCWEGLGSSPLESCSREPLSVGRVIQNEDSPGHGWGPR